MKNLLILLFLSGQIFSQGKTKITPNEISELKAELYLVKKRKEILINPITDTLQKGDRIRVHIKVIFKNGQEMSTYSKGKEGLKMNQFNYTVEGAKEEVKQSISTTVNVVRAIASKTTYVVQDGFYPNPKTGNIGLTIQMNHLNDKTNTFESFFPSERGTWESWFVKYHSLTIKAEISLDKKNEKYPLALKFYCEENPKLNLFYKINPITERFHIYVDGMSGYDGYNYDDRTVGGRGGDADDGGHLTIVFIGDAKKYKHRVTASCKRGIGGKGGRGYLGYAPDGRSGRDGSIKILYQD